MIDKNSLITSFVPDQSFVQKISEWYRQNMRDLPWRHTKDPYKIWLSEIILQQTRVSQGLSYYQKFEETFPTIEHFDSANEEEVLRLWQGLGYYSRARNMKAAARQVMAEYGGMFPNSFEELKKLKGVGDYTAAAIASFAFDEPNAVVDGNVYRVLSRYFGIEEDISTPAGQKYFFRAAQMLIPKNAPGEYNQAIMEFGALHCVPKSPNCETCVLRTNCKAALSKTVDSLPVKTKKTKQRNRFFNYLVVMRSNELLMKQRGSGDIWQGLFDFRLFESKSDISDQKHLNTDLTGLKFQSHSEQFLHILSHQKLHTRFWVFRSNGEFEKKEGEKFHSLEEIERLPKPVLISRFLEGLDF